MAVNSFQPLKSGKIIEDSVQIFIGGKAFHGWEGISVTESMESIANSFTATLHNKFSGLNETWPFRPGTPTRVAIGQDDVLTGHIESVDPSFGAGRRTFSMMGRSNSGDLIDCSHTGPMEFENIRLDSLAKKLIAPFGMKVLLSVEASDIKVIPKFAVKPSEKIFQALDRAARDQGFLWVSTRGGNIRLTKAAKFRGVSDLFQDVNVLSGSAKYDSTQRFSDYKVIGQSIGLDDFFGKDAATPSGSAKDLGVTRFRPTTIVSDSSITPENAKKRAGWEASIRIAKGSRVTLLVQGWRQKDGSLWGANQIHRVRSTFLGVDKDLLAVSVERKKANQGGTTTAITLVPTNAYEANPVVNKKSGDDLLLGSNF